MGSINELTSEFARYPEHAERKKFAVILAGGDGTRLKPLTRAIAGDERPKQFCPLFGSTTLLDKTRERVGLKFQQEDICFSLTQKHHEYYRAPLWSVPAEQMFVQPEKKGTAPAILFSLFRLEKCAPDATVAFVPSDHFVADDEAFMHQVGSAFKAVDVSPGAVVLLGIEPEKPETAYGWIEPANSLFGEVRNSISSVARFWEKPSTGTARRLMAKGCLWNSFVMVGRVRSFIDMFRTHLPEMTRLFEAAAEELGTARESAAIRTIYSQLTETNFSSTVLERASARLMVMRVGDIGWCDWGEPQRVLGTLTSLGIQPEWMHAVAA